MPWAAALLLTLACPTGACEEGGTPAPGATRVIAVRARVRKDEGLASFCDVVAGKAPAHRLALPALDQPPRWPVGQSRWVNVWATWCKPCVAEMPMLASWRDGLAQSSRPFALVFISADETAEKLAAWRAMNPKIPPSLHLTRPDALQPWLATLGLDQGAGLPIHIFADPAGQIRCVRAGAVSPAHRTLVSTLLKPQ
ncbi:MAG: TlpA family protein disulfide reductase [Acidobacteriota bacterium]